MADASYVTLYVPLEFKAAAIELIAQLYYPANEENESGALIGFAFSEVRYGELPDELRSALFRAGIAYDMDWEADGEWDSGTESVRFDEAGDMQRLTVYDGGKGVPINSLIESLDDHDRLKELIREHATKTIAWPWLNQIAFGKIFLARQLIEPTK